MAKPRKIVEVDYGISSVYGDGTIEINRKLAGNLRKEILEHEQRHGTGRYSKKDFDNDFHSKKPHFFEALQFAILNPEAIIGYFPIMYSYYLKIFTWNSTALYPFLWLGAIFSVFWWVLFKINIILSFLGWLSLVVIINIALLIYTHYYVKGQEKLKNS